MSDTKLSILEPLASYFDLLHKSTSLDQGKNGPGLVNIDFDNTDPDPDAIFWKMFANTRCYDADSNPDSKPEFGDIAHQFTKAVIGLALNMQTIDPSSTSGSIEAELLGRVEPAIKNAIGNIDTLKIFNIKDKDELNGLFTESIEKDTSNQYIFKSNDLVLNQDIIQIIFDVILNENDNLTNKSSNVQACKDFLDTLTIDSLTTEITEVVTKEKVLFRKLSDYLNDLDDKIKAWIKVNSAECFARKYTMISEIDNTNGLKDKIVEMLTNIENGNLKSALFVKYFELKDINGNNIDIADAKSNEATSRINLRKNPNGRALLFLDLPNNFIDTSDQDSGVIYVNNKNREAQLLTFSTLQENSQGLSMIAEAFYRGNDDTSMLDNELTTNALRQVVTYILNEDDNNDALKQVISFKELSPLDYTEAVCKNHIKGVTPTPTPTPTPVADTADPYTPPPPIAIATGTPSPSPIATGTPSPSPFTSDPDAAATTSTFDVSAIKTLINEWLKGEKTSNSKSTPYTRAAYKVLNKKEDREKFTADLKSDREEMEEIYKNLPENQWVKKGNVYYKRLSDETGKFTETKYLDGKSDDEQFDNTCKSIGYDGNVSGCIKALTSATKGDFKSLKELLDDATFVAALNDPDLVKLLPPQIALKLLKTFGFKKTIISSPRGPIHIIEPTLNWLNRIEKSNKELYDLVNGNTGLMKLVRFLVGIVHQNPTIIGNNPNVVIPKEKPVSVHAKSTKPINTWTISPETIAKYSAKSSGVSTGTSSSTSGLTLKDIIKGLDTKPRRDFYNGLSNLKNTPFGLSNLNPVFQQFLNYFPGAGTRAGYGFNGGARSSRIVARVQVGLGLESADNFSAVFNKIKDKVKGLVDDNDYIDKMEGRLTNLKTEENSLLEDLSKLQKLATLKELGLLSLVSGVKAENFDELIKNYDQRVKDYFKNRNKSEKLLTTFRRMVESTPTPTRLVDFGI